MRNYTDGRGARHERPERPLSLTSINKTITRLGQILEVAVERDLIDRNPVRVNPRNRKIKTSRPDRAYIDRPEHAEARLDYAGLWISEALDLEWRDVNLAAGRLRVRNSKTAAGTRHGDRLPVLQDELTTLKANAANAEPGRRSPRVMPLSSFPGPVLRASPLGHAKCTHLPSLSRSLKARTMRGFGRFAAN